MSFLLHCSFHNKLKTNPRYFNKRANRRCDDLIQVLLKIEEDMFYDRKRKEILSTPMDASLKIEGKQRHACGRKIPESSITVCILIIKLLVIFISDMFDSLLVTIGIRSTQWNKDANTL